MIIKKQSDIGSTMRGASFCASTRQCAQLMILLLIPLLLVFVHGRVSAHALGQETLSRHSLFQVSDGHLTLYYSVDMAEDPTFYELQRMDYDGDGTLSEAESELYIEDRAAAWSSNFEITVNDKPVALEMVDHELKIHLSGHELPVLYLSYEFVADLPPADVWNTTYVDGNFTKAIGWQEVVVQADSTVQLQQSSAPTGDLSARLTAVPEDLALNPVLQNAQFVFAPQVAVVEAETAAIQTNFFFTIASIVTVAALIGLGANLIRRRSTKNS